ncbi:hypothetical protein V6N13_077146 [Hibiscus sabdariffa]
MYYEFYVFLLFELKFRDLSLEEMKRFQRALASGELSKMIEPWDPRLLKPAATTICLSKDGARLVQPTVSPEDMPKAPASQFDIKF